MRDALRAAIATVVSAHERTCRLSAGSPSATVAAWRVNGANLDYLVLCDSSLLLSFQDGLYQEVTDQRMSRVVERWVDVALAQRFASRAEAAPAEILAMRKEAIETLRNVPGGFWCCHYEPDAADEAIEGSVPLAALRGVVLASDGATRGLHDLGIHTIEEVVRVALSGRHPVLLEQIRTAELERRESLASRAVKVHDDATLVSMRIG